MSVYNHFQKKTLNVVQEEPLTLIDKYRSTAKINEQKLLRK